MNLDTATIVALVSGFFILLSAVVNALSTAITQFLEHKSRRTEWLKDRRAKSVEELLNGISHQFQSTFLSIEEYRVKVAELILIINIHIYARELMGEERDTSINIKGILEIEELTLEFKKRIEAESRESLVNHQSSIMRWFAYSAPAYLTWFGNKRTVEASLRNLEKNFEDILSRQATCAKKYEDLLFKGRLYHFTKKLEHIRIVGTELNEVEGQFHKLISNRDHLIKDIRNLERRIYKQLS